MNAGDGEVDLVGDPVHAHGGALAVDGLQGDARSGGLAGLTGADQAGAQVVVGQEQGAQVLPGAEGDDAGADALQEGGGGQARVVTVEHDDVAGGLGDRVQQGGGVVDLAEAVELVAHDVEQEAGARADPGHEVHGVGLVELEDGDVGVQVAGGVDLGEQGGEHAAHEVRAGPVGEDLQALLAQELDDHLGGRGLAVGARDHDDAAGQAAEGALQETGVGALHDQAGEGGAAAAAAAHAGGQARCAAEGDRKTRTHGTPAG